MKKVFLSLSVLTVLSAVSCKKDDKSSSTSKANTWSIDGKSYTLNTSNRSTGVGGVAMADVAGNSLFFYFKNYPTTDGTYKIVRTADPAADEVDIQTLTPPASGGFVSKSSTSTLSVKVSGGKLSMTCSGVPLTIKNTAGDTSTATLSTNVTEL